jgi:hypothetical protein
MTGSGSPCRPGQQVAGRGGSSSSLRRSRASRDDAAGLVLAPRGSQVAGYAPGTRVHGVALGYFPDGPAGHGAVGLYVDTRPRALLAAAVFAVLFLLFSYVLVATARLHGGVARALLRPSADPLADARNVLASSASPGGAPRIARPRYSAGSPWS